MKKLNQVLSKVYPVLGSLLVVFVLIGGIKPASLWDFYQPRVPKIK